MRSTGLRGARRGQRVSEECCTAPSTASTETPSLAQPSWWRDPALLVPLAAGLALLVGLLTEFLGLDAGAAGAFIAAVALGGSTFAPGALRKLGGGTLTIGLLMTVAAVGAIALGQLAEAAMLAFLFAFAEALEHRAMRRARDGVHTLLTLLPETTYIVEAGEARQVPVAQLRVGDTISLRAGDRVPTDAVVHSGSSSLDASAVTGESIPAAIGPGDTVLAGSLNGSGALRLTATAPGSDSSLTHTVALVREAQAQKGERARLADRIARPLVPAILGLAALVAIVGLWTDDPRAWLERALIVLVAASPCALAISVPVTVISAIGALARIGVVVTSGSAFERLGGIRTIAFDKTGTLTSGTPRIVACHTAEGFAPDHVLSWAAAVERDSGHPLAAAFATAAPRALQATAVREKAGHGVAGIVDGGHVRVGSTRWVSPGPLGKRADALAADGMTVIVVSRDGAPAGVIGVRDELRADAARTVQRLTAQGVRTIMLTGDNARTARALGTAAGISDVRAEQLPADKAAAVRELSAGAPTAMVGDGMNDAPALATATVGIALGTAGSAAAVEAADVALTGHTLSALPTMLAHAKQSRRIMTQNIVLSIGIIAALVPLALSGALSLAGVVLVHEIAEVVVIANGLRAARLGRAARDGARDAGE